jgi:hypothetical protein
MVVCKSSSLNVAYEMGAYGLALRATEEEFVVFSFALPLSVDLSVSVAITAPEPPTWSGMACA